MRLITIFYIIVIILLGLLVAYLEDPRDYVWSNVAIERTTEE